MADTAVLTPAEDGQRLDAFLADSLPDLSRTRIQRLIADGYVTVDAERVRPSHRLAAGQTVAVALPEPVSTELEPQPAPLSVVHEDADLVVVDKPPGLTVHPAAGQPDGTLANALLALYPEVEGVGGPGRAGIVHRLDKGTSGLLVAAKNEAAHASLTAQFKDRLVSKRYTALVVGRRRRSVPSSKRRSAAIPGRGSAWPSCGTAGRPRRRTACWSATGATPSSRPPRRPGARTRSASTSPRSDTRWQATLPTGGAIRSSTASSSTPPSWRSGTPARATTVELRSELPPDLRRFLQSLHPLAPEAAVRH